MTLIERLTAAAELWARARERSLATLATMVVNDGNFFVRIAAPGADVRVGTVEKFARFLVDAGNWPDGDVPLGAVELAHAAGVKPPAEALSPDIAACDICSSRPEAAVSPAARDDSPAPPAGESLPGEAA